jgi:hypothetical protein
LKQQGARVIIIGRKPDAVASAAKGMARAENAEKTSPTRNLEQERTGNREKTLLSLFSPVHGIVPFGRPSASFRGHGRIGLRRVRCVLGRILRHKE